MSVRSSDLIGSCSGKRIGGAVVQATNLCAFVPRLIDLEVCADQKVCRKVLDCKPYGVCSARKSLVSERLVSGALASSGEQLSLRAVIEQFTVGCVIKAVHCKVSYGATERDHVEGTADISVMSVAASRKSISARLRELSRQGQNLVLGRLFFVIVGAPVRGTF